MKVLIVDDNPDSVDCIAHIIADFPDTIIKAYNGEEAIEITKKEAPYLILLDIMMPKLNGFQVCKILSNDISTKSIPIIMISAKTEVHDIKKGLEAGAYDYIRKPFAPTELLARVISAARFKKSQDELLKTKQRLESMNEELAHLAITDSLTQVYNHTFLISTLKYELSRTERFAKSMAFLMIDIDLFKQVNDTYGHLIGDEVLKEIVTIIKAPIRAIDVLGRYGGEEFGLLLPETNEKGAVVLAEKIRKHVEEHKFSVSDGVQYVSISLTVSIGVAIYPDKEVTNVLTLIKKADDALYISKNEGRNKVYKIK